MPLTLRSLRRWLAAPGMFLIAATCQAEVNSLAASTLTLQVGKERASYASPEDGRPRIVPGNHLQTSVESNLRVDGAGFDFGLAGGTAEAGVLLGRPYASAFSYVNSWPAPEAGSRLNADALGVSRVNYGGTVSGVVGHEGTVTIRGRFGQVAVGASTGLVRSSGMVEEVASVGVTTPGLARCAQPPCFDSDRLYAELLDSGSALESVDYNFELTVGVQVGDRLDLWLWAGARSVNGYSVFVGPVPSFGAGSRSLSLAADSAPVADWQMTMSFSDGLGLSSDSGLVAGPGGWSLPVPEASTWALWLAALAVLPIAVRRRRAS
ncbi:MAG: hypothetical protein EOP39_03500 [Rubrivivax sp.]|nr:MAG: hypothetical protein EOP39_03500 [Rubrivivax sp.]